MRRLFAFFLTLVMVAGMLLTAVIPAYATEESVLPLEETVPTEEALPVEPETIEPTSAQAPIRQTAYVIQSGTCGDSITWTLDGNGLLTISGIGPMWDFPYNSNKPWQSIRHDIKEIIIEPGVSTIGNFAFESCLYCTRITIPNTVTQIGNDAFSYCYNIEEIHIADLGAWLGITFKTIEANPMYRGILYVNGQKCEKLVIPEGVEEIPAYAFYNGNFTDISIPASVKKIGKQAFSQCNVSTSITFAGSAPTIEEDAFEDVVITVYYPQDDATWKSITDIGYGGTLGWYPAGAPYVDGYFSHDHPDTVRDLYWKLEGNTLYLDGDGYYGKLNAQIPWKGYRSLIHKLVMTGNIMSLPDYVFNNHYNLEEATIIGMENIPDNAFDHCRSLKKVVIDAPVWQIGCCSFAACTALEYVQLPEALIYINPKAFTGCTSLKTITMPSKLRRIFSSAFAACDSLESIYFTGNMPETFRNGFFINPAQRGVKLNIYYPSGNSTWSSSRIKAFQKFCDSSTFNFYKYSGMPAPKVKGTNHRFPILSWNAVTKADQYIIYRATSSSGKYNKVATLDGLTWQDMDTTGGKTYYYKVQAIDLDNLALSSKRSSAVSVAAKCEAPVIAMKNAESGKPYITWEKVSGAKKYTVYRATSENGKYTKLSTTTKTTYTDSKATTGSTYYYKVIANASSSKYNSGYSNIVFCNVICGAPAVKIKLDPTTGKPSLSWSKVTGAVEYVIFRQLPGEETFTEIARQSTVTFLDRTAPIVTECQYQVQAVGKSEDLNSQLSATVSATSGIAKPAAVGSINAVTGKPVITWQAVEGAVKYEIYRSTKSSKSYKLVTTVETLSYTDETVSAGKTYYYKIKAIGEVSKSADSSYVKLTGKCAQPVIQAEANETSGKPVISWEKVSGAKKYTVYRATSEGGKYTKLSTTTKLSYTDTKATAGKTYYYKVIANASSSKYNSGYSNMVSCLTHCAAPTVSVKTDAVTGKPSVSWNKVTGAVAYMVVRDGVDVCQTTNLSYKDEAAEPGKTYSYRVCALSEDQAANSSLSSSKTITATCAKPTLTGGLTPEGKPYGQWEAVESAESYKVYRSTKKSSGYKEIALDTDGNLFFDTTAKKGKTYYYKIVAVTAGTVSAQSNYIKVKSK